MEEEDKELQDIAKLIDINTDKLVQNFLDQPSPNGTRQIIKIVESKTNSKKQNPQTPSVSSVPFKLSSGNGLSNNDEINLTLLPSMSKVNSNLSAKVPSFLKREVP